MKWSAERLKFCKARINEHTCLTGTKAANTTQEHQKERTLRKDLIGRDRNKPMLSENTLTTERG